jgi:hypothetical protein
MTASQIVAAALAMDLSQLPKLLRGELDWIVMKALDNDRARRYETVNGLARDLERYLGGDAVDAGPVSTTYRLRKFAGRHRVGLAMAVTMAALLVASAVVSTWMRQRALGDAHPDTLMARALLGRVVLLQQKYAAAETTLRTALADYEKNAPDIWERYGCQSLLGESLANQKKFVEAEPLLLSGYNGMVQRQASIPVPDRVDLSEAGARIVRMYQAWGQLDKAADWRRILVQPPT